MYPFTYKVTYLNDFNTPSTPETIEGMGFAKNYAKAAKKIEDYYGSDLISIDKIFLLDEASVLELPTDVIERIEKLDA